MQELANVHRATIDNTAQQAEETQQQLTGLVTMLKVSCLGHASVPAHTVCHFNAHTNIVSTHWALWAHEELHCTARLEITQHMLHGAKARSGLCNTPFYMHWDEALGCACGLSMYPSIACCGICHGCKQTEAMLLQ